MTVLQAINTLRSTHEWPKVDARDGLTHRMHRYDRKAGVWKYACDEAFLEDATAVEVSCAPLTCVACMGLEGRTEFELPL